jgi:hypothetical protein
MELITQVKNIDAMEIYALMMEAASTSETSVNFYQTTQHNPEESHLLTPFD